MHFAKLLRQVRNASKGQSVLKRHLLSMSLVLYDNVYKGKIRLTRVSDLALSMPSPRNELARLRGPLATMVSGRFRSSSGTGLKGRFGFLP